jgi:predicted glutamine amidotransferase
MCRLLGYCIRADVSLAEIVGEDNLRGFTRLSEFNPDGWGVAWYERDQAHVEKSPLRASDSADYDDLVHRPLGNLGLVHLRGATPGLPVELHNTHPFRRGDVVMAHNGAIHPQDRLGELLPPAWERQLTGTTDSERYFLHVMSGLEAGSDVITALEHTTARIDRLFSSPNSLNAVLLTPDALYAVCYYWPERIPHAALAAKGIEGPTEPYFDLAYLETEAGIVVASSGWAQDGWTFLPNRHVLVIDRATLQVKVTPLNPPSSESPVSGPLSVPAAAASRSPGRERADGGQRPSGGRSARQRHGQGLAALHDVGGRLHRRHRRQAGLGLPLRRTAGHGGR